MRTQRNPNVSDGYTKMDIKSSEKGTFGIEVSNAYFVVGNVMAKVVRSPCILLFPLSNPVKHAMFRSLLNFYGVR